MKLVLPDSASFPGPSASVTIRAGDESAFLLDSTAYERLEGDRLTRVYEYRFMGDDFAGAEIID